MLSIWPVHHEYAVKELEFAVSLENSLIGDINGDGFINVLDIVIVVNVALGIDNNDLADINADGEVNVLDVVQLVNIILS